MKEDKLCFPCLICKEPFCLYIFYCSFFSKCSQEMERVSDCNYRGKSRQNTYFSLIVQTHIQIKENKSSCHLYYFLHKKWLFQLFSILFRQKKLIFSFPSNKEMMLCTEIRNKITKLRILNFTFVLDLLLTLK